jgi:chaperone required for assembly of F1-ATPase
MKKNWSKTIILKDNDFYNVFLDDKLLKSPEKKKFNFTELKLAKFLKKEIDQEGDEINFKNLFFFNLFSLAIDKIKNNKIKYIEEICEYASTDLICYRAEKPEELVELQNNLWNPVLQKLEKIDLKFKLAFGIMPIQQPFHSINKLKSKLSKLNILEITCMHELTRVTGSALLSYSMKCRYFNTKYIYECSFLDDIWQSKKWGKIDEISKDLSKKKIIINNIKNIFEVLK